MHLGLRLLAAILTFTVGVAASALLSSSRKAPCLTRVVTQAPPQVAPAPVLEAAPPAAVAPCRTFDGNDIRLNGGILNDRAVKKPDAIYPAAALVAGVEGEVVVRVVVDKDGAVTKAEAVSGPKLLRGAAVDAAQWATFPPTHMNGCAMTVTGVVTYNFKLD